MAEFNISGRMSVARLQNEFKAAYGLELRVYNGSKLAEASSTLASISSKKVDDFECAGNMKVSSFESRFSTATGLKVQIATLPNAAVEPGKLVNNDFTLSQASKKFGVK